MRHDLTEPTLPPEATEPTPSLDASEQSPLWHARWQAVQGRDAQADGRFVFAVTSTGIYCRASCPARRPKAQHVRFFDQPASAEAAGFRACRRCHPNGQSPHGATAALIAQACHLLAADPPPPLAELARIIGVSPYHLHRQFKAQTGLTPQAWARAARAERLRDGLAGKDSTATVTQTVYAAGFNSPAPFYAQADAMLGMAPKAFLQGGRGEELRYALAPCDLGLVLVAQSARGICALTLGDAAPELIADLGRRFPQASITRDDTDLAAVLTQVVAFVEAPGLGWSLPLDLRGTAFQARVWQALQQIPAGGTASYTEIAAAIGAPAAVRAVAQACGANPVAVAVPCHRVLRRDGALSGYRWGIERKRALLKREAERQD